MESIIHPLLQYALLAAGLGLSALLFLTLKQDIQKAQNRSMEPARALGKTISQLKAEISELKYSLAEIDRRTGELPQGVRPLADRLMRRVHLDCGMSRFRAWYTWKGVRLFAASFAEPKPA